MRLSREGKKCIDGGGGNGTISTVCSPVSHDKLDMMVPTVILESGMHSQDEACWLASLDYLLNPMTVRGHLEDGQHMRNNKHLMLTSRLLRHIDTCRPPHRNMQTHTQTHTQRHRLTHRDTQIYTDTHKH